MLRRIIALTLVAVLLSQAPRVDARHRTCFYDPRDMQAIGCSTNDVRMLALMSRMQAARFADDSAEHLVAWMRALELRMSDPSVSVDFAAPLSHYQVSDSAWIGGDTKIMVLPNRQVIFFDTLQRQAKVKASFTTGRVKAAFNWWLAFVGGLAVGAGAQALLWGRSALAITSMEGGLALGFAYAMDSLPEAGETEFLLHMLDDRNTGAARVYRSNVRVDSAGRIRVAAPWAHIGHYAGEGDW